VPYSKGCQFRLKTHREETTLETDMHGKIILKSILKEEGLRKWIEFIWLMAAFSGRLVNLVMKSQVP